MSFEEQPDFARQVADLNKYGQALNRCETVEEVVSLTLEAMSLLFDFSSTTYVDARREGPRVLESTHPDRDPGDPGGETAKRAMEERETIISEDDHATLAVPAVVADEVSAVLVIRSTTTDEIRDEHVRPLEILASHAATAIGNIRSRERLERARKDLETRKEMVEMYDRLLRHDLRNDLQVVAGFSDMIADIGEGEVADYGERIGRTARSSADLITRVGTLVSTLESDEEPEPMDLAEVLEDVVEDVRHQYENLTVSYDPGGFDYRVYAGDLLDTMLANLLSNAAVHNESEVNVHITAEEPDVDHVAVVIADDGAGIPAEIHDELFEMGAKGPESEGTGFGLGFVRTLVESYGGGVSLVEGEEGGAAFRVRLQLV